MAPVNLSKKRKFNEEPIFEYDTASQMDEDTASQKEGQSNCSDCNSSQMNVGKGTHETANKNNATTPDRPEESESRVVDDNCQNNQTDEGAQNWWHVSCQLSCYNCKADIMVADSAKQVTCVCGEDQYVARPCCVDADSTHRFAVKLRELYTDCCICKSEMVRLPCCQNFQPKMQLSDNILDCVECSKYSIVCVCKNVNILPPKATSWKCGNF